MAATSTSGTSPHPASDSPRSGAAAAPVSLLSSSGLASSRSPSLLIGQLSSSSLEYNRSNGLGGISFLHPHSPRSPVARRRRSHSGEKMMSSPGTPGRASCKSLLGPSTAEKAQARAARKLNDSLVYLDGPQVYTCAQCRTHLTSHDEIISKSFHGRHGRAYLFDNCVNVGIGPAEDRYLITGLHSVCDIFCKRCKNMVGWTYAKAYETSQKYKEGKYIIEKINLHLEASDYFDVAPPAGERKDRFRARSISWGSECSSSHRSETIYEYWPSASEPPLAKQPEATKPGCGVAASGVHGRST
mmetsp:Transcript_36415/g.56543  ORF Transcript_36415/g.56543 Transcript_36415/m.56543 type:complete len:301 (-) Transcript_36415:174-1076(-)|eukprot:CAMPEP_0117015102 /NCGR_PEP_ID=MMETSP0472-20121206/12129_1 /TAXON_ID=693140 ORGANISM="Tiarina fusus, Strain LIS" /NCGR_SAMPLE_ID=MMETSP0472 /ASSEMBLY_ACC=CAM_ASM_000603 /LENGTH=300 /DNA_ID=CAMNT_0004718829 /DNA_START=266 /DNA_END=1168 /DNA_ORIENTATION=-